MLILLDEISRMKIKSDLKGFKEWKEGNSHFLKKYYRQVLRYVISKLKPNALHGPPNRISCDFGHYITSRILTVFIILSFFPSFAEFSFSILVDGQPAVTLICQSNFVRIFVNIYL